MGLVKGSMGAETTFLVAAYDAHKRTKNRADFVCTGANDEAEINAAIALLPEKGGRVLLSEGTFVIGSADGIRIERGNVALEGMGVGITNLTTWVDAPAKPMIDVNPTPMARLEHIRLANFSVRSPTVTARHNRIGIRVQRVSDVFVSWVHVRNFTDAGLDVADLYDCRFRDVLINTCGDNATQKPNAIVRGSKLLEGSVDESTSYVDFIGCVFERYYYRGMHLADDGTATKRMNDVRFIGCKFHGLAYGEDGWEANSYPSVVVDRASDLYLDSCEFPVQNGSALILDHAASVARVNNCIFRAATSGNTSCAVDILNAATRTGIANCLFDGFGTGVLRIQDAGSVGTVFVFNNIINSAASPVSWVSGTLRAFGNGGFVTEKQGWDSIASGQTSKVVNHGLSGTPSTKDIYVTPTNNPTNDPGWIFVASITATTFTVSCRNDPGASTLGFNWQARLPVP